MGSQHTHTLSFVLPVLPGSGLYTGINLHVTELSVSGYTSSRLICTNQTRVREAQTFIHETVSAEERHWVVVLTLF